jgi:hypothetical protein
MAEQHITETPQRVQPREDVVKPPIPKWAYRIVNPTMAALLRSPLHRLLSNALMLLTFQGWKSGKRYTIPVGYMQEGNRLYIFSHAGWWKNLPGRQVVVRLRGKDVRGTVKRLEDKHEIAKVVRWSIDQRGETMAQRMGLLEYADPDRPGPLPQRTKFFEITLEEPAG